MAATVDYLRDQRFRALFTEVLGWEHAAGDFYLSLDGREFLFVAIAHKRGLQILCCSTDRVALVNRTLLRKLQRLVLRKVHEHILIFCCEEPRKQVWQWAIRLPDGRNLCHREHPFFSNAPPTPFLSRLDRLRFTLDEEQSVTLVDALNRVRQVLDTTADQNLFVKRPWYAARSDELARAMEDGSTDAFHRFVLFHVKLARNICKRFCRWSGMLPDDAEQIALLGLLRAAHRYRPELGYQFSTFATYWIKQACQREGPDSALMIRLPVHVFWPCLRLHSMLERRVSAVGAAGIRAFLNELEEQDPVLGKQLRDFERATSIRSLSERRYFVAARRIAEPCSDPVNDWNRLEAAEHVHRALSKLNRRHAEVLRLRYGLDGCPEQTLKEVGKHFGITRERARQIQSSAEKRLCRILLEAIHDQGTCESEVSAQQARSEAKEECPASSSA